MLLVMVLLLVSCASAPLKLKAVPGDYVAESPRMQVGDSWKFRHPKGVIEGVVVSVNEDDSYRLKVTRNNDKFEYVDVDKDHHWKNTIRKKQPEDTGIGINGGWFYS